MVCVRPAGEDGGAFAALFEAEWLQGCKVQQNTGTQLLLKILRERKKADGAVKRGRGLADGMAKREDGRPSPEGWQRPGPCRAGLCSWRSSSTSALLPAVLEEDRAGAPGRVHLGYPCSPDGVREDHVAGTGAWGPHGRGAAGGASRTLSGASEAAFQPELVPEGPLPGVELWMRVVRGDDAGGGRGLRCGLADVLRSARVAQHHGGVGSAQLHGSQQLRPYAVRRPKRCCYIMRGFLP